MRKSKAIKTAVCIASASMCLSFFSMTAHAEENEPVGQGVAGASLSIDNFLANEASSDEDGTSKNLSAADAIAPFGDKGASIADPYVNIRKEPTTDSEVIGKLYRGCFADILEYLDGDWVKIKSGDVTGYIARNYLAIGKDAEPMVEKYTEKYATVTTQTLKVREEQDTDSRVVALIPEGETYVVVKEYDKWVKIILGTDDDTGKDYTGYVSKDYVSIKIKYKYAISIEEENRRIQAELEAEKAEKERLQKLAEEKAEREEQQRREEEQASQNDNDNDSDNNNDNNNDSGDQNNSSSGDVSSLQSEIVNYALKFVGNPYVWGGTSLTHGADCSGFVQAIYSDFGYSIPRVSRDQARYAGREVSLGSLEPGDLLFYTDSNGEVNHVAMYIGSGQIVQAANSRQGIIVSKYNYREPYRARRIVD